MKLSVRTICMVAMFTAVISVLSIMQIPTPWGVPFTLQTFAMALCGYVLGWKYGTLSTILYILIGAIGVPVFAGMSAGVGILTGATGGYLFGFIIMTFLCGIGRVYIEEGCQRYCLACSIFSTWIGGLSHPWYYSVKICGKFIMGSRSNKRFCSLSCKRYCICDWCLSGSACNSPCTSFYKLTGLGE